MSCVSPDIHRLKIGGCWAEYNANSNAIKLSYANGMFRAINFDKIASAVKVHKEVMLTFATELSFSNRGNKMSDNLVVKFDNNIQVDQFSAILRTNGVSFYDASDCPSLQLANNATTFMHDDVVAWRLGNNCNVFAFNDVKAVVFQRLNGGSSTFDVSFITDTKVKTLEYIPHHLLGNWVDYIPPWVLQYTNGADPININHVRTHLENKASISDWAPDMFDVLSFDEENYEDEHIADDDSDYVPEEEGESGSETESDEEFDDADECSS